MASVNKRTWKAANGETKSAWRVTYTDRKSGQSYTRQFNRKRDADAWRIKVESEMVQGIHVPARASITVSDATTNWIATREREGLTDGTIKQYRELKNLHIDPLLGETKLSELDGPTINTYRSALLETRSPQMASKAVRALSMVLNVAIASGFVAHNAAASFNVKIPDSAKKEIVIPTRDHLMALIDAAGELSVDEAGLDVMVKLVVFTGLRQSEVRALTWADIDLTDQRVSVTQKADRWNNITVPKSRAGRRTIPIGSTLAQDLRRWKLACPISKQRLVFPNQRGNVLTQHRIIDLFLKVQIEAGLAIHDGDKWRSRYGWHDLRHAAASMWIKQKIDLKRIQYRLGHAGIQLTLNIYGHLIEDASADLAEAEAMERAVLG